MTLLCPICNQELKPKLGAVECPHCGVALQITAPCPDCGAPLERLQACGAVDYLCPKDGLISKKRVTHLITKR